MSIITKTKKTIEQNQLIKKGDLIMLGVSGGADSMALLHVLNRLRSDLGFQICVVHIDHQLRKHSQADERFVKQTCQSLQLPYVSRKVRIITKKKGLPSEEAARDKRLGALIQLKKLKKGDAIALAHHQDDVAETVLLRLLRGTGLLGLQAILPKKIINGHAVIRPFVEITRLEIEQYLQKNKFQYRRDITNKNKKFFRNKIRMNLIPLLEKEYNPNTKRILANLAANVSIDYDYLQNEIQKTYQSLTKGTAQNGTIKLKRATLSTLHPSMQRMIIRQSIEQLKGNLRRIQLSHLKEIDDLLNNRPVGAIVDLPAGVSCKKDKAHLVLLRRNP